MAGSLNLVATTSSWENGSFQRRIRPTNQHGVSGPEHDILNADWDESSWDTTSNCCEEPQDSAVLLVELFSATQDGRVDCMSSVSESEDGDLHTTMSAMQSPARTFTDARDPCCSSGNRERQQRRSKGCQDWKTWKRQSPEHERKERENVKGQGQVKRGHHVASFVTSLATRAEGRGQVTKGHHVASFVTSLATWTEGQLQVTRGHHVASFVTSLATWAEGRGQVKRCHHVASFVTSLARPKGKGRSKMGQHVASFVTSLATWAEGQGQVKMGHNVP